MLPPIKGFLETSFVDWPGKVSSVLFLPGCNFRCPYCHNHRLVLHPEEVPTWPAELVFERLESLRGWVDGVCVTGGEPTLQPELGELLSVLRYRNLSVKLDTNGSRPGVLAPLLTAGLVDAVALDLKAPLEAVPYRRNAGAGSDPEAVAQTLQVLGSWAGWVEIRTTLHPDLLSLDELLRLAAQAGRALASNPTARFTLQACRPSEVLDPSLRDRPGLPQEDLARWSEAAREAFEGAARVAGGSLPSVRR